MLQWENVIQMATKARDATEKETNIPKRRNRNADRIQERGVGTRKVSLSGKIKQRKTVTTRGTLSAAFRPKRNLILRTVEEMRISYRSLASSSDRNLASPRTERRKENNYFESLQVISPHYRGNRPRRGHTNRGGCLMETVTQIFYDRLKRVQ